MHPQLTTSDRRRFEAKVDRSAGPDACHPWVGARNAKGRGRFKVGGRMEYAHRIAWRLAGHEITEERPHVLHHCDNPPCCNDRHLWDGTHADNMRDMARKGRASRGTPGMLPFGVYRASRSTRFYAHIKADGKTVYLGSHGTAEQASAAAAIARNAIEADRPASLPPPNHEERAMSTTLTTDQLAAAIRQARGFVAATYVDTRRVAGAKLGIGNVVCEIANLLPEGEREAWIALASGQ